MNLLWSYYFTWITIVRIIFLDSPRLYDSHERRVSMRLRAGQGGGPNASTSDLSNPKQAKWVSLINILHKIKSIHAFWLIFVLFFLFPFLYFIYLSWSSHPWMMGNLCVMFICFGSASGVVLASPIQTAAGQAAGPPRRGSASKEPPRLKKWILILNIFHFYFFFPKKKNF